MRILPSSEVSCCCGCAVLNDHFPAASLLLSGMKLISYAEDSKGGACLCGKDSIDG